MWPRPERAKADLRDALHARALRSAPGEQTPRPRLETLTDTELIERFLAPYAKKTQENYRPVLRRWSEDAALAGYRLLDAPGDLLYDYVSACIRSGQYKPRSLRSIGITLRSFYRWASQADIITENPARLIPKLVGGSRSEQRPLSRDELRSFLLAAEDREPPWPGIMLIFGLTGTRRNEVLFSRIEHMETFEGRQVIYLGNRKMKDTHRVVVPDRVVPHLRASIGGRSSGLIFRYQRKQVNPLAMYKVMDSICEHAGIKQRIRPHQMRAAFVTFSREAGMSARDIAAAIGVASSAQVDYYDRHWRSLSRQAGNRLTDWLEI